MTMTNERHEHASTSTDTNVAAIEHEVDRVIAQHRDELRELLATNATVARAETLALVVDAEGASCAALGDVRDLCELYTPVAAALLTSAAPAGCVWLVVLGAHATVIRSWHPQRGES